MKDTVGERAVAKVGPGVFRCVKANESFKDGS
eukprot:CAMPEP_0204393864 /NCGR_PEP_ID=MMETSP0469-20131031/62549_1 /ASSEMBLY_ACC=CAM_ASM_000384 /TAXON_ID=2969 /ORGANISM="Oxyrrhis marina" /LENGTH=31 /DNA_ID= /DNA_START= /DNA_END= /DNA_ORIENTATION=